MDLGGLGEGEGRGDVGFAAGAGGWRGGGGHAHICMSIYMLEYMGEEMVIGGDAVRDYGLKFRYTEQKCEN